MIASAVGLFLIATLGYVLLGARTGARGLEALSRIQEDARFAFEVMASDIRMAGFTGGPAFNGGQCANTVNNPGGAWDANLMGLCTQPLIGYEGGVSAFPTGVTGRAGLTGDALTVVRADDSAPLALANAAGNCSGVNPCTLPAPWPGSGAPEEGDILVVADPTRVAVFQASDVNSGARTITHTLGSPPNPGNGTGDLGAFNADAQVRLLYPLRGATYFVATNATTGELSLHRLELIESGGNASTEAREIVEGIEDIQIQYGEDTNAPTDGQVNAYRTANNVVDWANVLSARITLDLVACMAETPVTECAAANLLRKTLTSTITVRNRLP
jgi:type IV pilus assembly protein PilW